MARCGMVSALVLWAAPAFSERLPRLVAAVTGGGQRTVRRPPCGSKPSGTCRNLSALRATNRFRSANGCHGRFGHGHHGAEPVATAGSNAVFPPARRALVRAAAPATPAPGRTRWLGRWGSRANSRTSTCRPASHDRGSVTGPVRDGKSMASVATSSDAVRGERSMLLSVSSWRTIRG